MLSNQYLKTLVFISCFLFSFSLYAQILNLSDNFSDSRQPLITSRNDQIYTFWVDGETDSQNICYRHKINDEWSESNTLFFSSNLQLKSAISSGNNIYLLWIQNEITESKLMIGVLDESYSFASNEIICYNDYQIVSASLFIDNLQQLNVTWETYQVSDCVRIFYSFANDIYNWEDSEIIFESPTSAVFEYDYLSQLAMDSQNNLYCFWLSNDELNTISYRIKSPSGVWESISQLYDSSNEIAFGVNFVVKNDSYGNIHLVSNGPYLLTFHNDLVYLFWNGFEWSNPEIVPYWSNYSPLNERWNPDIAFLADNSVYITWEHYAYSDDLFLRGSWIGSSVMLNEDWHENSAIAFNRNPKKPHIQIKDNEILNVWYDDTDGNDDIYFTITEPATSSDENVLNPEHYGNCKNFPNPFNPSTTIEFSITNDSVVDISIYNVKGQKIKTLVNKDFTEGKHIIIWNGDDESGESVSSGIYFYKLKINSISHQIHKCILMK
ncbi:MAG: T9SS type A sorting domain-containing protein [Candidatus Cloacimonetes bacterium]|nr:T9SS type A sorting domain-containing protein [Candidatus Cloacimonadota bacterium]